MQQQVRCQRQPWQQRSPRQRQRQVQAAAAPPLGCSCPSRCSCKLQLLAALQPPRWRGQLRACCRPWLRLQRVLLSAGALLELGRPCTCPTVLLPLAGPSAPPPGLPRAASWRPGWWGWGWQQPAPHCSRHCCARSTPVTQRLQRLLCTVRLLLLLLHQTPSGLCGCCCSSCCWWCCCRAASHCGYGQLPYCPDPQGPAGPPAAAAQAAAALTCLNQLLLQQHRQAGLAAPPLQ